MVGTLSKEFLGLPKGSILTIAYRGKSTYGVKYIINENSTIDESDNYFGMASYFKQIFLSN